MEYRLARLDDIPAVARLFQVSFAQSVRHFLGQPLKSDRCLCDIFAFLLKAEPGSFFVAAEGQTVAGYLIASRNIRAIWLKALLTGSLFIWAYRWLSGQYAVSWAAVRTLIGHKLSFLTSRHNFRFLSGAQIISIAVHPRYRNRGHGRSLLACGLAYLSASREVKLEVRPENKTACRLYTKWGFMPVATTCDSQGDWIVMVRKNPGM